MLFNIYLTIKVFRFYTRMHECIIFRNISFTYEQKQTTRFKESEAVIFDFRRLRSGQVWEPQSQEKHATEEGKEKGGGGSAGRVTAFSVLSIFFHANAKHMHL